jgi:uncharacterized protein YqfA (UPF0365 family)
MLALILLVLAMLIIVCYLAFLIGCGAMTRISIRAAGISIGVMLIICSKLLYVKRVNSVKVVKCDKCGSETHPWSKYCGECGFKRT